MGGFWIPNSFVAAPQDIWERLSNVIHLDDWYRHVAVTRENATQLRLRDGEQRTFVSINDGIIEVFERLKSFGDDAAIIFDRVHGSCWLTSQKDIDSFLAYSNEIDDQF